MDKFNTIKIRAIDSFKKAEKEFEIFVEQMQKIVEEKESLIERLVIEKDQDLKILKKIIIQLKLQKIQLIFEDDEVQRIIQLNQEIKQQQLMDNQLIIAENNLEESK